MGHAIGGALVGFAIKSGYVGKLPAIPVIGRTGAAAFLLDYWAKHGGGSLARQGATAAAVLAGFQLGSTGTVTGDELSGDMDGYDMDGLETTGDMDGDSADGLVTTGDGE